MAQVYTCSSCKHYIIDGKCKAFPKGIPDIIWKGNDEHKKPLPTQKNSIVYEEFDNSNANT